MQIHLNESPVSYPQDSALIECIFIDLQFAIDIDLAETVTTCVNTSYSACRNVIYAAHLTSRHPLKSGSAASAPETQANLIDIYT